MNKLKEQLSSYYSTISMCECEEENIHSIQNNEDFIKVRDTIYSKMDVYKAENPNADAVELKSELHSKIAEYFEPVIFDELPFFYEMGIKPSESWGFPDGRLPSLWGMSPEWNDIHNSDPDLVSISVGVNKLGYSCGKVFDTDHHCIGYTKLFKVGIKGLLEEIEYEKSNSNLDIEKYRFLLSAEKSCLAVLKIAEKFSSKAKFLLKNCKDANKRKNLELIRDTAKKIPKNPPESFYEGLCMIWFTREVFASLEGVGISVLGRVDKLLGNLYENDVKRGKLDREEAKYLIKMWLAITHIKFSAEVGEWPDSSTCIVLGGCDESGLPVFNEVTKLVIEAHEELNYVIPKINCRVSKNSPDEYIDIISKSILRGRNVYSILNDEAIIDGLVYNGKTLADARNFVNGGCQETIVEGEHSAGVWFYFNTPKIIEHTICGVSDSIKEAITENALYFLPDVATGANSFEDFYKIFLENTKKAIRCSVDFRNKIGKEQKNNHPCPLFSSTLDGCLQSGKDYTNGGAKYNNSTIGFTGLGTVVDSLFAIKTNVFDEKIITLNELSKVLESNWELNPELREKMISAHKYGHGVKEVDELASRLITDVNDYVMKLDNERNGKCILSMFTYIFNSSGGSFVGATPDGRKNGDIFSQGVTASNLRCPDCVLDTISSVSSLDFRKTGGINVLDINLPFDKYLKPDILDSIIKVFIDGNGHALQMNYVSKDELLDAQINPEQHKNLIVRVAGLSVYFINLSKGNQDEFIRRNFYNS